jgi:hypothetical protein
MFDFIKKLLGYPTDAEKAQAIAQATEAPLVQLGPEPVVEKPAPTPVAEPTAVKASPAASTAKKKPAQKKPAQKKPATAKTTAPAKPATPAAPAGRTRGRKPKPKV